MDKLNRLTKSIEIQRVRRLGRSLAHPLLVLLSLPNENNRQPSRLSIITGKGVGNAVHRNRARRRIREALREHANGIKPGFDLIVIARQKIACAEYREIVNALDEVLKRAQLMETIDVRE